MARLTGTQADPRLCDRPANVDGRGQLGAMAAGVNRALVLVGMPI